MRTRGRSKQVFALLRSRPFGFCEEPLLYRVGVVGLAIPAAVVKEPTIVEQSNLTAIPLVKGTHDLIAEPIRQAYPLLR